MDSRQIMSTFYKYVDGVRLLMLTTRNKDGGPNGRPDRFAEKRISMGIDDFRKHLNELLELKQDGMRIYSSVNPRNFDKGIREFKRRQLEADYYDLNQRNKFYLDAKNQFHSALAKPGSKDGSLFIIDADTQEEYDLAVKLRLEVPFTIINDFKTKNGWHFVTEPFNPTDVPLEIKKDGMLLLNW